MPAPGGKFAGSASSSRGYAGSTSSGYAGARSNTPSSGRSGGFGGSLGGGSAGNYGGSNSGASKGPSSASRAGAASAAASNRAGSNSGASTGNTSRSDTPSSGRSSGSRIGGLLGGPGGAGGVRNTGGTQRQATTSARVGGTILSNPSRASQSSGLLSPRNANALAQLNRLDRALVEEGTRTGKKYNTNTAYGINLRDRSLFSGIQPDVDFGPVPPSVMNKLIDTAIINRHLGNRPIGINDAFDLEGHSPTGAHPMGLGIDLQAASPAERAGLVRAASQAGFTKTGTYGPGLGGVHVDTRPNKPGQLGMWGGPGGVGKVPGWHSAAVAAGKAQPADWGGIATAMNGGIPTASLPSLADAVSRPGSPKMQDRIAAERAITAGLSRNPFDTGRGIPGQPNPSAYSSGPGFASVARNAFDTGRGIAGLPSPSGYGGGPGLGGIVQSAENMQGGDIRGLGNPSGNFGGPGFASLSQNPFDTQRGNVGQPNPSGNFGGPGFAGLERNAFDTGRGIAGRPNPSGYFGGPGAPPSFASADMGRRSISPQLAAQMAAGLAPQVAQGIPNEPGRAGPIEVADLPQPGEPYSPDEPMDIRPQPQAPYQYGVKPGAPAPGVIGPMPYMNPVYSFGVPGRPKGTRRDAIAPRGVQTAGTIGLGLAGLPAAGTITDVMQGLGARARMGRVGTGGPYTEGMDHGYSYEGGSGANGRMWTGNEPPEQVADMQRHVEEVLRGYFVQIPGQQYPQYTTGTA